ncbi:2-C-methyl-D-erythritol 4-phosphate cytidylyltransferase [Bifidobacterium actinocoloniiforme DSM 22766]|uniref:2-C-methyl-D-erythritol 4-phosphate cytidylyltransferase n=1 Tax=Bifidobacterium actinocoloniiforme DSM 22766 TaxID=1437605 RepID=A0A086Z1X8_9BIFI|nr:2-C-methyl-D-erythritol 4-phosphate cytidylyltransferase [Bifidobacterium actinocoloniiforme DSM 22766]
MALPEWVDIVNEYVRDCRLSKVVEVVPGGSSGFQSIRRGLRYLEGHYDDQDIVLIHDGVRPLLSEEVINANIAVVKKYGNAVTAVPATETLLYTDNGESSRELVGRTHILRTQTLKV